MTTAPAWATPESGAPNRGRRPPGTGPTTSTARSTEPAPRPRLLPAERTEHDALLGTADAEQLPA
ncbi:hypothetical protein ACFU9B_39125 [Streptomyces sp. NPDC057592]|uniref:hypothetical protein n=1 Tax=unclassified Streptomyces TaxID=2593676 RepID=UPI0036924325